MTSETDASTGEESTTDDTTVPTTTINPSTSIDPSTSTSVSGTDTDDMTTGDPTTDTTTTDPTETTTTEPDTGSSSGGEPVCGDDQVGGDEECDGIDLDLQNCIALDFDGGTLACTGECTFDTAGCTTCGDTMIAGDEECEADDVGGATCVSEGFVSGELGCAADCTFDTSACSTCGDGDIDAGEDCDGGDLGGSVCTGLGMGFTGGTLACNGTCGFDTTGCTNFAQPGAGHVVVTEIMQNPTTVPDEDGEWFELHNPSTTTTYQLSGCTIEGSNDNGFAIDADLTIAPGGFLLFGESTMVDPGFTADFTWAGADFNLTNTADRVALVCAGMLVDEVEYDDTMGFPDPAGASMNLDPTLLDAVSNDSGSNWCTATLSYNGDLGTPGDANTVCDAETTYTIGFCRLQFPVTINDVEGTDIDVFGRVFVSGLTDLSGVNDPAAEVIGYVGYGPDGTDPATDGSWVWTAGAPNAGYGPASPAYEGNNDEYQATLTVPSPPGTYDFAFRFSGDSGATFTYCDGDNAGSSDGYEIAEAGQLTSTAAPPPANMYFSEYVEGSSNNKALEIYNADTVAGDLDLCEVRLYSNGSLVVGTTIALSGSLAAGQTYVVCDDSIVDPTNCDLLSGASFYNGDDAIELNCQGTTLDVFGLIGNDPGSEWSGGGVTTQDETLRRDCAVTTGDTNGGDAFDPSVEWDGFMVDTFGDLGQYVCP